MRALICGGREWLKERETFDALDRIHARTPITFVIEGGQRTRDPKTRQIIGGADYWGYVWAKKNGIHGVTCPAQWTKLGKKAGFIRNLAMAKKHKPDIVIVFPGGTGTAHMRNTARELGIPVHEVYPDAKLDELPGSNAKVLAGLPQRSP